MHYPDLENYRFADKEYPYLKNIGWLDITHDFNQGEVDKGLLEKLHFLTCLMKSQPLHLNRKQRKKFKEPIIIVHTNFMRMFPFKCPFCQTEVELLSKNDKLIQLGRNEIEIPSIGGDYLYNFPSMLYHYMAVHQYLPPTEFLNALEKFDLTKDFDCIEISNQLHKNRHKIAKKGSRERGLEIVKKLQQLHGDT